MFVVPSASDAAAVISADPPLAILSAIVLASLSESVTDPTSCSSTSVSVTVNCVDAWLLSALVALTVTVQEVAVS